MVDKVLCLTGS